MHLRSYAMLVVRFLPMFIPLSMASSVEESGPLESAGDSASEAWEYPWLCSIFKNGGYRCSGAFVGSRHVVTAGRCVDNAVGTEVEAGYWCREKGNCGDEFGPIKVRELHRHESGDLVLLVLNRHVSVKVKPAVPYLGPTIHPGQRDLKKRPTMFVVGAGQEGRGNGIPDSVGKLEVQYVQTKQCKKIVKPTLITESVVCMASNEAGSPCRGDSGAPLIVAGRKKLKGRDVILAIQIMGPSNCSDASPDQVLLHFRMQDAADLLFSFVCNSPNPEDWCGGPNLPAISPTPAHVAGATTPIQPPNPHQHTQHHSYISSEAVLHEGDSIISDDGKYACTIQSDGNFVGYEMLGEPIPRVFWSSETSGHGTPPFRLVLQHDGNLVLYDGENRHLWATGTGGKGSSHLHMQDDRNIVLYNDSGHTWASSTQTQTTQHQEHISSGVHLHAGDSIISNSGEYSCTLHSDGNLVGYEVETGELFWSSHSGGYGQPPYRLVLQHGGNLIIYDAENKPIWNTGTDGRGNSRLQMQDDRNIVIHNDSGPTWASWTELPGSISSGANPSRG